MKDLPGGYTLVALDVVDSTNSEAKALARAGAVAGTLVWAREQTAGRGRRGRIWASPPGNLYLSLVLRPRCRAAAAAQLGFVAALGIADAIAAVAGPDPRLRFKWPNDLLLDGAKLAGILLETELVAGAEVPDFVVLGIGVNTASAPRDVAYPATSLAAAGLTDVTAERLLPAFAAHCAGWLDVWLDRGFAPVRDAWLTRAVGLGEATRVQLGPATLDGRFLDLDDDGALVLEAADGSRRRIAAGEIFPAAPAA